MGIIGIINVPLLIGAIGILLFFLWLGRYAEKIDKNRELKVRSKSKGKT